MSGQPDDVGVEGTEEQDFLVAELVIRYAIHPDGEDTIVLSARDNGGGVPPLITMLGMLEMAKEPAYELAAGGGDEDDDGEGDD